MALIQQRSITLKSILDSSKKNHKLDILKEATVKDAHIYCKCEKLSGQVAGPLIESYIKEKYNMSKNNASLCNGDLKQNDTNFELKASLGGQHNNQFNFVQFRMNHDCNYLLTAYYLNYENLINNGELYIFKLVKSDLIDLIFKYGGYAHGTIKKHGKITLEDLSNSTNDKEYAIRPKYGDSCWNALLPFRVIDI
jgi:hypothetical protein